MIKNKIRVGPYLYPMPLVLIGAMVQEKPNFMPLAWVSIVEHKPPMISISANESHYTNKGVKANKTFSVNFVSEEMVKIADYCGIKSGKEIDKSQLFKVFFGDLKTAPLIQDAPLNLECKVVQIIDLKKGHDIFIGEIVNAYAEEKYLTNGIPDMKKMKSLVFSMNDNNYWKIGELIGKAWSIGKDYKKD